MSPSYQLIQVYSQPDGTWVAQWSRPGETTTVTVDGFSRRFHDPDAVRAAALANPPKGSP